MCSRRVLQSFSTISKHTPKCACSSFKEIMNIVFQAVDPKQ